jgi:cardiolipin synthase
VIVIDDSYGFTGGANLRLERRKREGEYHFDRELHFFFAGNLAKHLNRIFYEDWAFTTGNEQKLDSLDRVESATSGEFFCRMIPDGPDEDFEVLSYVLESALLKAEKEILIQTPYFLPNKTLRKILSIKALSGVKVRVLIPKDNNLSIINWAGWGIYRQLLKDGVELFFSGPHFDHSKFLVIDGEYAMVGSANWDDRSLRLNFELNVEVFHDLFASQLVQLFDEKLKPSKRVRRADLQRKGVFSHFRDQVSKLLIPYL